jgi:hypothetical protein
MDDCMSSKGTWVNDPNILELFFNGRHHHISFILTMQYSVGIPPEMRSNFDYIFLLAEDIISNRKRLYEHYAGMFPTFDIFQQVFTAITEDYGIFASFILLLIQLAVSSVPHIIRLVRNCPNKTMTFGYLIKSVVDVSIENGVGDLLPTILQFVPFIGMFVSIIESLPILGGIASEVIYAIGYIGTYVIVNMLNGYDFNRQCNIRSISDLATSDRIASMVGMIASLFVLFTS